MRIKNAKIFQPDGTFKEADLVTEGERIKSDAAADGDVLDAYDFYCLPGLIDVRLAKTPDTAFDEGGNYAIDKIGRELASMGVTAWLGSTKLPADHAEKVASVVADWNANDAENHDGSARIAGLALERPIEHIDESKAPEDESWKDLAYDDADVFAKVNESGLFKLVDVDAAKPGADKYIDLVSKKAAVALADTDPTFSEAEKAIKAGAKLVSRAWGKKSELDEKAPSVVDAAYKNADVKLELLAGEDKIEKENLLSTFALFQDRIVLTAADGDLMEAMKRAIELGVPEADAINAATVTPAVALGLESEMGTLEDGKLANVVVVDKYFHVKHVVNRGKLIF